MQYAQPAGPPARLFRLATSEGGNEFVQTYDRFAARWRFYGHQRGRDIADIMVHLGLAAWAEPRS
jgi:endonuclease YncB( thermonuclease family)